MLSALVPSLLVAGLAAGPATAVPPTDPKYLAAVEGERSPYDECWARVEREYPLPDTKARPKPKTREEAQRNLDDAMKQVKDTMKRLEGLEACAKSFRGAALAKLKEAGATDEEADRAMQAWYAAREKAQSSGKTAKK